MRGEVRRDRAGAGGLDGGPAGPVHRRGDGARGSGQSGAPGALDAAGVPYLRMKIKAGYTAADIQAAIASRLGKPVAKPEPMFKGLVKKGPTRPVRSLKPAVDNGNRLPVPALSHSQIKAQQTALIQAS